MVANEAGCVQAESGTWAIAVIGRCPGLQYSPRNMEAQGQIWQEQD